jgi:hypothetical protein
MTSAAPVTLGCVGATPLTAGMSCAGGVLSNCPHQSFCPVTGQKTLGEGVGDAGALK